MVDDSDPSGPGWNFRMHCIYMPFFAVFNLIWLWIGIIAIFPSSLKDEFVWGGGLLTWHGFWLIAAAALPLGYAFSTLLLWVIFTFGPFFTRGSGGGDLAAVATREGFYKVNPRLLLVGILWLALMSPLLYKQAETFFRLGPNGAEFASGNPWKLHQHPWSELQELKASCKKSTESGYELSIAFAFPGDTAVSAESDPKDVEFFLNDYRKLGAALKGQPFKYSTDIAPGCPSAWRPALVIRPGGPAQGAAKRQG